MKTLPLLSALALSGILVSGCANYRANVENKMGRGMANGAEIFRGGEFRRSVEQTALFEGPDAGYTTGAVRGVDRTLARTGIGLYEMITAPFPPYDPVCTDYIAPGTVYPDSYAPGIAADSTFATDSQTGFSGGDVLPIVPGSRFSIFNTH